MAEIIESIPRRDGVDLLCGRKHAGAAVLARQSAKPMPVLQVNELAGDWHPSVHDLTLAHVRRLT
jgi:hypothetical protein